MAIKTVYQHDADGYYVGEDKSYDGGLPANAVWVKPVIKAGFISHWTGTAWEQVEDHRGKRGFVSGQLVDIKEPGPLPAGWSETWVDPRPPQEIRRQEILTRLSDIDLESIRPIRAVNKLLQKEAELAVLEADESADSADVESLRAEVQALQTATEYDRNKLQQFDAEAATLRLELTGLPADADNAEGDDA
jgi:hypothetical protein